VNDPLMEIAEIILHRMDEAEKRLDEAWANLERAMRDA
jgi:exonuclease VII small subunit